MPNIGQTFDIRKTCYKSRINKKILGKTYAKVMMNLCQTYAKHSPAIKVTKVKHMSFVQ